MPFWGSSKEVAPKYSQEMDPETKLQVQNAKHEVVAITEMLNRFVDNLSQSPYSLSLSFYTPTAHDTSVVLCCLYLSLSTFLYFLSVSP